MKKTKRDDDDAGMKTMTVAAIKSELKRRHLPTDGTKKVLAARLDDAVSKEEEEKEKEKDGGLTAENAGKRTSKATEKKNEEKGGTKRKGRTMDFDEKADVLDDDSTLKKRQKTTTTTTKSAVDDVSTKEPTPPSAPTPRRGRSRSKSVEPEETITEEERKKKDEKRNGGGGKAAAAMKEKMQKAKELMKKQKALAEKMKKKKTEREDKGDGEAPPPMTTTTTTTTTTTRTTRTMQPPISAQQAIEKARETAARLAALQHQRKKNKQSNQSITESKFEKTGPAPVLRVNEKGQEVDENGKVIVRAKDYTATTKVNEKQKMRQAFLQAEREVAMEEMRRRGDLAGGKKEEQTKEDMIDPEISVKQKHNRKKSSLQVRRRRSFFLSFSFSSFRTLYMQGTLSYQSYIFP